MKKIFLIIEREFLTRVRKKSFIIMTILAPLLFAGFMVGYVFIITMKDSKEQKILVADQTGFFADKLQSTNQIKFTATPFTSTDSLKKQLLKDKQDALLYIEGGTTLEPAKVVIYSEKQLNMDIESGIKRQLDEIVESEKLKAYNIENINQILADIKTNIPITTVRWEKDGVEKESHTGVLMGVALVGGFIIYMFIFMFGSMVMRGVIEEKSSRIVEVIISSVKPFQLMIGKIIGVASVGLLQFVIWIVLTISIVFAVQGFMGGDVQKMATEQAATMSTPANGMAAGSMSTISNGSSLSTMLDSIPIVSTLISFLFFFIGGYLLYAAMFAAIGSAVENETDTQQMIMPVTIPLIIGFLIMMNTFQYPNSSLAFWGSMIPLTSPMVMMARIPFGVPMWEIVLSLVILFGSFIAVTALSAKIYRVGILMYGKKPSFKEMLKWITYKG